MEELKASIKELIRSQREMRKELSCIRETWEKFSDAYIPHLRLSVERDQKRAKLQDAIIEKTTIGALSAILAFIFYGVWNQIKAMLH